MLNNLKVVKIDSEYIEFDNGMRMYSEHETQCCEEHYLLFSDLSIEDFEGLEFDLSNDNFFERIEGYGIALLPKNNHPVRIAAYTNSWGNYSADLELIITQPDGKSIYKSYDITECQDL